MKNMQWLLATLLVVLVASGCGGGGGGGSTSTDAGSSSALRSISVTPSSATLAIGGTQQLTVTGVDSSGKSATLTSGLTFTTPAATILSVSGSGLITAVAVGNETVTVKSGDLTATANVTVNGPYAAVSAGGTHTLARKTDGTLWGWGRNLFGQVGDGTRSNRTMPVQITVGGKALTYASFSAGGLHSTGINAADSSLYTWGSFQNGRLGDTAQADKLSPVKIGSATWSVVAAGGSHNLGVRKDGTLWSWGRNSDGQLGLGNFGDASVPTAVQATVKTWTLASAGDRHSVAIRGAEPASSPPLPCTATPKSNVWTWGDDSSGQLGHEPVGSKSVPTCLKSPDTREFQAVAVAAGGRHTLAIRSDGSLWSWGANDVGQLGRPDAAAVTNPPKMVCLEPACNTPNEFRWIAIAAGTDHSLALRSDGTLWSWGNNEYAQLGDETTTSSGIPIRITNGTDWTSVSAGNAFSFAVRANGTLWGWGRNQEGQLGNGTDGPTAANVTKPTLLP